MKKRALAILAILLLLFGVPGLLMGWESVRPTQANKARRDLQTVLSPFAQSIRWVAVRLSKSLEFVVTAGKAHQYNRLLEKRIARLEAENQFLRESLSKYQRLDQGAALAETGGWKIVEADVTAYSGRPWSRSLVINRGTADGIALGDPVLHTNGLAGVVSSAAGHNATVQLLSDPQSAVGVVALPLRVRGVVKGTGEQDKLEITLEDATVALHPGEQIITSGMEGSLYPRGLPVGTVSRLKMNRFGQAIAEVHPSVAFGQIEEVLVLRTAGRRRPAAPPAPSLSPQAQAAKPTATSPKK